MDCAHRHSVPFLVVSAPELLNERPVQALAAFTVLF